MQPQDTRPRARDAGLRIGQLPTGTHNAITDVAGVRVGHTTLIEGDGPLQPGQGPIRTGVTVVLPHPGNLYRDKVPAAIHVINGFGKCMGQEQVDELGTLESPIALTGTMNVGRVTDAIVAWSIRENPDVGIDAATVNPIVGECSDAYLNDMQGRHVREEHVFRLHGHRYSLVSRRWTAARALSTTRPSRKRTWMRVCRSSSSRSMRHS